LLPVPEVLDRIGSRSPWPVALVPKSVPHGSRQEIARR